jgi:iron(III) transport system substrate-binding protein
MKHSLTILSVSCALLIGGASVAMAGYHITPQKKKLIAGAKKEGSVTLIHPLFSDATTKALRAAFNKYYGLGDSFKLNTLRKGTGATVAQVRQEMKAGKIIADVLLVHNPSFFAAASKAGKFLKLDSGQWKHSEANAKNAGQYSNYPYAVVPLAYLFQPIWNASCPGMSNFSVGSYADATVASVKGKTISSDITKSSTYTNTVIALGEAGAVDFKSFWPKLKTTDPIIEFRTEPKMQMVISCQRPFDMWNLAGRVYQNVKKKPDLKDKLKLGTYKEGLVALGNQIAVIKGTKNPNAGKLLVEFLLSKAGTDIFVEGEAVYSFRAGYSVPDATKPYLLDLSKEKVLGMKDWVGASKKYKTTRDEWSKNFR